MRHIVVDPDREVILRLRLGQLVEDALHHGRRELLRRQPITPADHRRLDGEWQVSILCQCSHNVLIERLAHSARLLAAVENSNRLDRSGQRSQESARVEWPIEANLQQPQLLALLVQQIDGFFGSLCARAHQHNHTLRIGRAVVIEQVVGAAGLRGKAIHHRLHDSRNRRMEGIAGLASLEENIGILRRAANDRPVRRQRVLAERNNVLVVHHRPDGLVADGQDLAHFVRSAEPVKEMNERNAGFKRGDLRHQCQVVYLLNGIGGQHRPARRPASHHVGVVAEDRQRMGGQGPGRHVHGRRGQLAGNLEHVGNHQQQALRRRKCGPERPCLQCPMQRACRAAFALQFFHNGQRAPNILLPFRAPLIRPLGHRRRGGNRIDCNHFGETIGHRGGRLVPIQNHHFLFTHSLCLTARPEEKSRWNESLLTGV